MGKIDDTIPDIGFLAALVITIVFGLALQLAGDWKEMAISARKAWEENFSDEVLLDRIVDNIEGLALTQSKAQLFIRECKYRIWKQGIKLKVVAGQTLAKLKSLT